MTTLSSIKRFILPACLIAGLILFFMTGLHQKISFQQLAQSYGEIKLFVTEQRVLAPDDIFYCLFSGCCHVPANCQFANPFRWRHFWLVGGTYHYYGGHCRRRAGLSGRKEPVTGLAETENRRIYAETETGFRKNGFSYLLALR